MRCQRSVLSAGCPCGISPSPLRPAAPRPHRCPCQWERPEQAGPLPGCRGQATTPRWKVPRFPLSAQPCCREAMDRRAGAWGFFRDAAGQVQCVACWRGRPEPQSFGSKWRSSEGGVGGQRGLRGSYVFRVFVKRGVKSTGWWVCTKHQQRPLPRSRGEGACPGCRSFRDTFPPRPLPGPQPKAGLGRRGEGAGVPSPPSPQGPPVRPAPYSFSSFISTMSVLSSAAGMSVMAESSPSTADSFSIFFFCFR